MRIARLSVLFLCVSILVGCETLQPCGDFEFTGTEFDTAASNGVDMDVAFDFEPTDCGCNCTCDEIPYVQIVRTWSFEDAQPLYPSTEKAQRATTNGWYIDRIAGRIWGYYGRNDDGTFASYLTPGSNTVDAVLRDSPRRPQMDPWLDIWWQAVSVPVCIDSGAPCENRLLGYYFWSWLVDDAGTVTGIIDLNAWERLDDEVLDAVGEWNTQAPGLGKNQFPTFSRMQSGACGAISSPPVGRVCSATQKCCEPGTRDLCLLCWPQALECP